MYPKEKNIAAKSDHMTQDGAGQYCPAPFFVDSYVALGVFGGTVKGTVKSYAQIRLQTPAE